MALGIKMIPGHRVASYDFVMRDHLLKQGWTCEICGTLGVSGRDEDINFNLCLACLVRTLQAEDILSGKLNPEPNP